MEGGHRAGVQTGKQFGERESDMRKRKEEELRSYDESLSGAAAETVYRDKKGKKMDMLNEFMRQQAIQEGKSVKIETAQFEWGKGSVQKENAIERAKELQEIAEAPFARSVEDPKLEKMRREALHADDPMYAYFNRKKQEEDELEYERSAAETAKLLGTDNNSTAMPMKSGTKIPRKPRYSGPPAPHTRFNVIGKPVPPGYRWDGVDRGNKLEKKIILKMSEKSGNSEAEYKWSVASM